LLADATRRRVNPMAIADPSRDEVAEALGDRYSAPRPIQRK
jgi:hypothetical protein